MGDIADGIINGDFDEQTGEYIGPGDGFPRTMVKRSKRPRIIKSSLLATTNKKKLKTICYPC